MNEPYIEILKYLHGHLMTASQEDGYVEATLTGTLDEFNEAMELLCKTIDCTHE